MRIDVGIIVLLGYKWYTSIYQTGRLWITLIDFHNNVSCVIVELIEYANMNMNLLRTFSYSKPNNLHSYWTKGASEKMT